MRIVASIKRIKNNLESFSFDVNTSKLFNFLKNWEIQNPNQENAIYDDDYEMNIEDQGNINAINLVPEDQTKEIRHEKNVPRYCRVKKRKIRGV